ncbi:Outer membrane protein beta-barrel domain-containing protein [Prosthecobacter debontii]|uniref:Outer membrane protein beta-barrel domain-containing protein n=1 Tax=Prosthecobacter debontii TaxID=48467 RepID=A0A1T4WL69_9BACT|nr:outer membrane beta-barrel protein [Prosthecobacter debontii]SKA77648.1 Outer membrane protein beta-barrel domain-containing protein [Prosthecobacter debontii]
MRPLALFLVSLCALTASAAELELKSLGGGEGIAQKRKYGPYVGVSVGESISQDGNVKIGDRKFGLDDSDGAAIFSIEVGKSWKMKKVPLMMSVDVEGTFMSTQLSGKSKDATQPTGGSRLATDTVAYNADMNSLFFNLNGTFALDLYRYRARIGKFAAGFRPYIGAGLGGGQVWYRNATAKSRAQYNGTGTDAASSTPFSVDEFINSWNWYAGLEWTWKDQYSVFFEYRDFHYGDLEELTNFASDGYLVGFRYRY